MRLTYKIGPIIGIKRDTVDWWLYRRVGLPTPGQLKRARAVALYDDGKRQSEIVELTGLGRSSVYEILKEERRVSKTSGEDPFVYESLTKSGLKSLPPGFRDADGYRRILRYIIETQEKYGRGPTRAEICDSVGFSPQSRLNNMIDMGILSRRKFPKEKL